MARYSDCVSGGDHASRPAANAVPAAGTYACTDHRKIYQSNGSAWSDWHDGSGGLSLIDSEVLASAATTVTFASIPSTFNHLLIKGVARSDNANPHSHLAIQFNNDTGANYGRQHHQELVNSADSTSAQSAGDYAGASSLLVALLGGTPPEADIPVVFDVSINAYASTTFAKVVMGWSAGAAEDGSGNDSLETSHHSGIWRSTSAITEIDLSSSTGDDFIAGSEFYLYGIT